MTAIPNQHWGGENHTSVSRFVTSIVAPRILLLLSGRACVVTVGPLHNGHLRDTRKWPL